MSHLQPRFIAQAKAQEKQTRAPRAMPRSMILEESRAIPTMGRRDDFQGWYHWDYGSLDHRIFTLKK